MHSSCDLIRKFLSGEAQFIPKGTNEFKTSIVFHYTFPQLVYLKRCFSMIFIECKLKLNALKFKPGGPGFVDVEDVARAHISAFETPAAAGNRYLCNAGDVRE
jgi:nucleoside-diphosphate-sugar epimerase